MEGNHVVPEHGESIPIFFIDSNTFVPFSPTFISLANVFFQLPVLWQEESGLAVSIFRL